MLLSVLGCIARVFCAPVWASFMGRLSGEPWVIAPSSVTCPDSLRVEATSAEGARVDYNPATPADGVSASTSIQYSHPTGVNFPLGETPITVTVDDPAYPVRRCSFVVTVSDTTGPTLVCPQSVRREGTSQQETVTWSPAVVSDAVSEAQVRYSKESGHLPRVPASAMKLASSARHRDMTS